MVDVKHKLAHKRVDKEMECDRQYTKEETNTSITRNNFSVEKRNESSFTIFHSVIQEITLRGLELSSLA